MKFLKRAYQILRENAIFLLMVLPGLVWLILFFYIPVFGNVIAFKDFRISSGGFIDSINNSEWVGLQNFKFLFASKDAWIITRNTVFYNLGFIFIGLVAAVSLAIIFSELRSKKMVKFYQTVMLFPYFLSWVIISFFVYSFLSPDRGMLNNILKDLGKGTISWYTFLPFWPPFLIFIGIWKGLGYSNIIYYASIMGIDPSYYEAAVIDGASKWKMVKHITLPQLTPLITVLTILAVGSIFRADFGLFYQVPRNSGPLYNVISVLDTYVYNGLVATGDLGMATAAGLYQSCVGLVLVVSINLIVRRLDKDSALF